jgi:GGDEF domain-containing protein
VTLHEVPDAGLDPAASGSGVERGNVLGMMLFQWRLRCGARRSAAGATSGPRAVALCVSVIATLEGRGPASDLTRAAHTWRTEVESPAEARAALLCLCELATEMAGDVTGHPPGHLDDVLEQLVHEAASVPTPREAAGVDRLTGCPDRRALEHDLDRDAAAAIVRGADLTVVSLELDPTHSVTPHRASRLANADEVRALSLVATLRTTLGARDRLYRSGPRAFAVVAPRRDTVGVGELMLSATCAAGVGFSWGAASLRQAMVAGAAESPSLLLVLAEADRHMRRRDFAHAHAAMVRRRRVSALASVAAVGVLASGVTFGLDSASVPTSPLRTALRGRAPTHGPTAPSATAPPTRNPPTTAPPPTVPPTTAPPPTTVLATVSSGTAAGPATGADLVRSLTPKGNSRTSPPPTTTPPAMTVSLVTPPPTVAPPPPAPPPPVPATHPKKLGKGRGAAGSPTGGSTAGAAPVGPGGNHRHHHQHP